MAKNKFYAVKAGRGKVPYIYETWAECKEAVIGFSGVKYKSFKSREEAEEYLNSTPSLKVVHREDNNQVLSAYVDGSYKALEGNYSFGMVCLLDGQVVHRDYGVGINEDAVSMMNVSGEIMGSMKAVEYAIKNNYPAIRIFHDYKGIACWADGEWKAKNKHTKAYAEFIKKAREKIDISFSKVKGHSGNKYNDLADKLASRAFEEVNTFL